MVGMEGHGKTTLVKKVFERVSLIFIPYVKLIKYIKYFGVYK